MEVSLYLQRMPHQATFGFFIVGVSLYWQRMTHQATFGYIYSGGQFIFVEKATSSQSAWREPLTFGRKTGNPNQLRLGELKHLSHLTKKTFNFK